LVCVGSAIIVESAPLEAADACHGGDSCVLWEFLGSRQNIIAVKLLTKELVQNVLISLIKVYKKKKIRVASKLLGLAALSIKIYESTLELVQKISISLIEVYEKIGLPAHL
jgi:hypothetical protein